MNLKLQKHGSLSIKEQIKHQIRGLVRSGDLAPEEKLPSTNRLAAQLEVNRNTIHGAYKELADEGWLVLTKGKGSFVSPRKETDRGLSELLDGTIKEALSQGYLLDELTDVFLSRVAAATSRETMPRVLAIECNRPTLSEICRVIEGAYQLEVQPELIGNLEKDPGLLEELADGVDLIVCGMGHLDEIRRLPPAAKPPLLGLMLYPIMPIYNRLSALEDGAKVGFTCVNERAASTFCRDIKGSQPPRLQYDWAAADDPAALARLCRSCDVIFASHFVYDRVKDLAPAHVSLERVEVTVDQAGLNLIGQKLGIG